MYQKFKHWLRSIFNTKKPLSESEFVLNEYQVLMDKIFYARTLSELLEAQVQLKKFSQLVYERGNPSWAINRVKFAKRYWNKRYKVWKTRG